MMCDEIQALYISFECYLLFCHGITNWWFKLTDGPLDIVGNAWFWVLRSNYSPPTNVLLRYEHKSVWWSSRYTWSGTVEMCAGVLSVNRPWSYVRHFHVEIFILSCGPFKSKLTASRQTKRTSHSSLEFANAYRFDMHAVTNQELQLYLSTLVNSAKGKRVGTVSFIVLHFIRTRNANTRHCNGWNRMCL